MHGLSRRSLMEQGALVSHEPSILSEEIISFKHYREYGGPKPAPINHHGIADAYVEKGSTVHYYYRRRWLKLLGARLKTAKRKGHRTTLWTRLAGE